MEPTKQRNQGILSVHADPEPLYFETEDVLDNLSFFWVGRGGHAITHPGNERVRNIVKTKTMDYLKLPRHRRSDVAKHLICAGGALHGTRFVIPRDSVLSNLDHDEQDQRFNPDRKQPRRIGKSRRASILGAHGSIEKIRSYPLGVCIQVGFNWTVDILNHMLREDADVGRRILHDLVDEGEPRATTSSEARALNSEQENNSRKRAISPSHKNTPHKEIPVEIGLPLQDDGLEAIDDLFSFLLGADGDVVLPPEESNSTKKQRRARDGS